tara:strand:- start:12939 stop:13352 length:414 start_codon:yes stop_codon:yes gene_type:complete
MKNKKQKGSNAERELIHKFWKHDWAACRIAGSGSMSYPSPDILASNNIRKLAIECKATGNTKQYITKKQVDELKLFSSKFGAESWIGVRFDSDRWYFFNIEDMKISRGKNYLIDFKTAKLKGLMFKELIGVFKQERL